ncbi:MAG: small subunit ribosomal protein S11 [Myxococcota bacterium]|jgi:small subunit ribosomal protein S11
MVKYSGKKISAKNKKTIVNGVVHVCATFNNTIISITDPAGNLVCWSSAGKHGFKGSRKATPYAAQVATQSAVEAAKECGLQSVVVEILGPGVGREASLRALQAANITVTAIVDRTYHPHNGCRPAKRRRV